MERDGKRWEEIGKTGNTGSDGGNWEAAEEKAPSMQLNVRVSAIGCAGPRGWMHRFTRL